MPSLGLSRLANCLRNDSLEPGSRIHNLTDSSIELHIRVGSRTKKVHTLKPGSSKRLKSETLYNGSSRNDLLYYEDDEPWHPYVLIHEIRSGFSKMAKQLYINVEDLEDCSEIKVYRDHQRGCISLRKKARHVSF